MKDWYKDWFSSELYLAVYNHRNDDDAEKLCRLILSSADLQKGAKILDAACGAGRHANRFSLLGFNVAGFDLSMTLLTEAVNTAKEKKLSTKFFCGDIRNVPLKSSFDLIVNLFTSFGYFESDEENFSFVKQSYSLLNKKGFYVLDYLNEKTLRKNLVAQSEKEVNGKRIIERREISGNRVVKEINVLCKNQNHKFFESVRLYSKDEIVEKAKSFGFVVQRIFGDYLGGEFDENSSNRLITVFRK
ncbi:MAG: SAM-dependent methyltransferase [Ignavibacteria bacterium]|nr:MAG: SAM-dependent methyltransferase [Ignavibacteria bacterium]KAF0162416.1 MAG: SAM-dependent methyltransferase [Ignavibacteria bacterium]